MQIISVYYFRMEDTDPTKPKRKRGPKTELPPHQGVTRVNMTLDDMTMRKLRVMGEGNVSAGVRLAVKLSFERFHDVKRRN